MRSSKKFVAAWTSNLMKTKKPTGIYIGLTLVSNQRSSQNYDPTRGLTSSQEFRRLLARITLHETSQGWRRYSRMSINFSPKRGSYQETLMTLNNSSARRRQRPLSLSPSTFARVKESIWCVTMQILTCVRVSS